MNINDPTNLTHLSDLVNQYTVNKNLDLEAIEKDMIGSSGVRRAPEVDPTDAFRSAMNELTQDIGINLEGNVNFGSFDEPPQIRRTPKNQPEIQNEDYVDELDEINEAATTNQPYQEPDQSNDFFDTIRNDYGTTGIEPVDNLYDNDRATPQRRSPVKKEPLRARNLQPQNPYQNQYQPQDPYQQQYQDPYQQQYQDPYQNDMNYGYQPNQAYDPNRYNPNYYDSGGQGYDPRRDQLNNVMNAYGGGMLDEQSLKKEQEEDTKSILLEDIDELKFELEDDGVDISRVPEVDQDSPLSDVQKVHKMYRVKYIRRRYNDFGHEIILAGAQGLGYIFDGERKVGPYKPNLSGWDSEVRTKLRRMRYETATIVSDIVQEYNIGPVSRLFFELIPSAVLYSNHKRNNHGSQNYSIDAVSQAIGELRETV
jgi:hypothetical protein